MERFGTPLTRYARTVGHMNTRRMTSLSLVTLLPATIALAAGAGLRASHASAARATDPLVLSGRIVATGIPGASAISAVGTFHAGGPIHDDPILLP